MPQKKSIIPNAKIKILKELKLQGKTKSGTQGQITLLPGEEHIVQIDGNKAKIDFELFTEPLFISLDDIEVL